MTHLTGKIYTEMKWIHELHKFKATTRRRTIAWYITTAHS
jgi:hypothetical protein